MDVLVLGLNYAPEPVGIGPYTAGMARALVEAGHAATVVCAKPYYPHWKADPAFAGGGAQRGVEDGVRVVRLPIYVPALPTAARRVLHHLSFAVQAGRALRAEMRRARPDVVIAVAPSLISAVVARRAAHRVGAKLWLHVQDFEVEAAFATGLLSSEGLAARVARRFEACALRADRISTISPQMCARLLERGIGRDKIVEFRNWANLDEIVPPAQASGLRAEWRIDRPHVAVYSGNLGRKQGSEMIVEAARLLRHRHDLAFVICGDGPERERLVASAHGLDNIQFQPLQPRERLPELLGMATIHLLPQVAGVADLVLPSKLTNMLASGRPVVAIAPEGSGLAREAEGCGLVTAPADVAGFAGAIERLVDDGLLRIRLGRAARLRAEERWSRLAILAGFERQLRALVS